ncbi:MAG: FliH/SctL family protein [Clostridia bacterium]|nr:FliH/SctL family protein [Clostridia bacterium]
MTTSPHNGGDKRVSLPTFDELVEAGAIVVPTYHEDVEADAASPDAAADPVAEKLAQERSKLKAESRRIKQECDKMRQDAEQDAMAIRAEAAKQAEEIREKAKKEIEDTIQARYEMEVGHLRDTVAKAAEGFQTKKDELFAGMQKRMLDTCMGIAEDILHYELDKSADAYRSIVQNAVTMLDTEERMTLRVPPVAYERLFGGKDNALLRQMEERQVKVLKDSDVKEGDALVVTDRGNIRVGTQTQSARLRETVLMKWGEKQ